MADQIGDRLGKSKVVAFVATRDPARAKAFYRDVLGLRFVGEDQFMLIFDAFRTTLLVSIVQEMTPVKHTVLGWQVNDIVATLKELQRAGVKFERYPGMPQDELGIWQTPGGGGVAWFKDPDGNTLSISRFTDRVS